jgi:anthranilate phosphoribosyltransferase
MNRSTSQIATNAGSAAPFPAARFIMEIGRGKKGARSMSRQDAQQLYEAMLAGRVSDLEMGGILLAMRIKGESVDEIAGFLIAAEAATERLTMPPGALAPIVLPSYNGSRQAPNLTPLLAMLLARGGAPVLIHGVETDPGRVTTAEILLAMGSGPVRSHDDAARHFERGQPVFMPIDDLSPRLARLLAMRRNLGVRNSAHTLVKILQPFEGPALRLTSYTHPEYLAMLSDYGQCKTGATDRMVPWRPTDRPGRTPGAGGRLAGPSRGERCGNHGALDRSGPERGATRAATDPGPGPALPSGGF